VRHFPGAGNYRECDVANLAEPAPTLAFLLRRHTRNRELWYAALGDCREPDYRLWRTFWIIGLGWDRSSRGFGFIIFGAAMRRSRRSPECIPRSPKNGSGNRPVTTTLDLYGHDAGGCASRLDAAFGDTIRAIGEQKRNRRTFRGISFGSNFGRNRRPEAGELSILPG
jgi:hypothetical protein